MKALAIPFVILLAACTSAQPTVDISSGDAEKFINRSNLDFTAAAARGDADTMMKMYADDAVLLAPNEPIRRGHDAVRQYWNGLLSAGKVDATIVASDVMQSCDMATEIGTYKLSIARPGAENIGDTGKYVVTWRKRGGQWRAVADIFNSDLRK
jgi:ketosteroid isomerase-like protein